MTRTPAEILRLQAEAEITYRTGQLAMAQRRIDQDVANGRGPARADMVQVANYGSLIKSLAASLQDALVGAGLHGPAPATKREGRSTNVQRHGAGSAGFAR